MAECCPVQPASACDVGFGESGTGHLGNRSDMSGIACGWRHVSLLLQVKTEQVVAHSRACYELCTTFHSSGETTVRPSLGVFGR